VGGEDLQAWHVAWDILFAVPGDLARVGWLLTAIHGKPIAPKVRDWLCQGFRIVVEGRWQTGPLCLELTRPMFPRPPTPVGPGNGPGTAEEAGPEQKPALAEADAPPAVPPGSTNAGPGPAETPVAGTADTPEGGGNDPSAWGLEFLPGKIKCGEDSVKLSGKPYECMREIYDAYERVLNCMKLRTRVWGADQYTAPGTIKNAVSEGRDALRKLARKVFGNLKADYNPVPCVSQSRKNQNDEDLAWAIDWPPQ
jgi:hypothetical protein